MAAAIDFVELANYLECSICLDKYDNPKQLKCSHLYCKGCIEKIIEFRDDGSAIIQCPKRCPEQTFLADYQTTNDLVTSYEIKGILEVFKKKGESLDEPKSICTYTKDCQKDNSICCCGYIMCKSCNAIHEKTKEYHGGKTDVFFDKNENKLKVLCKEHLCKCTHLCLDNNFLCTYCLHRVHKNHAKDTIENQAAKIREALVNDTKQNENVCEHLRVTKKCILASKKKLDDSLRERKIACLSSYLDFLNKEEEVMRTEFQNNCCNHIKQYPVVNSADYHQKNLQQNDIELATQKNAILDNICKHNLKNSSLNCVTASLSDSFDFRNEHPLGDMHIAVGEEISFCNLNPPVSTLKVNTKQLNDYEDILSKVSAEIKELLQEEAEQPVTSCLTAHKLVTVCPGVPMQLPFHQIEEEKLKFTEVLVSKKKKGKQRYKEFDAKESVCNNDMLSAFVDTHVEPTTETHPEPVKAAQKPPEEITWRDKMIYSAQQLQQLTPNLSSQQASLMQGPMQTQGRPIYSNSAESQPIRPIVGAGRMPQYGTGSYMTSGYTQGQPTEVTSGYPGHSYHVQPQTQFMQNGMQPFQGYSNITYNQRASQYPQPVYVVQQGNFQSNVVLAQQMQTSQNHTIQKPPRQQQHMFPQMSSVHTTQQPPTISMPQQPPPDQPSQKERTAIKLTDPNTGKDLTSEILKKEGTTAKVPPPLNQDENIKAKTAQ